MEQVWKMAAYKGSGFPRFVLFFWLAPGTWQERKAAWLGARRVTVSGCQSWFWGWEWPRLTFWHLTHGGQHVRPTVSITA